MEKSLVLDSQQVVRKIRRLAHEILENNHREEKIILAGIAGQGFNLAERLHQLLKEISSMEVILTQIQVDKNNPYDKEVNIDLEEEIYTGACIIVVDDVLNSGKTMMYGIKAFLNTKISKLKTAVLINRNHKRFPVLANYVGLSLATTFQEHIEVSLEPNNESVYLS